MTRVPPLSLRRLLPLSLLLFATSLSAFSLLYQMPRAELAAVDDARTRVAQEMSRLQSTLEYQLLKGDVAGAQHEIAVLAHNHDVNAAALIDERGHVIAATRRAWLGRPISAVMSKFDAAAAASAAADRQARLVVDAPARSMFGYAGVLLGRSGAELRPTRVGSLLLDVDLGRAQAQARAQMLRQSAYWAGWVIALAALLWLAFHFLLTRRTERLVQAAERIAAGDLEARSGLDGNDELGRLGRAFDAMATKIAATQQRLEQDLAERARVYRALEHSEASYRAIFDATEDAVFVIDIDSAAIVDANPKACAVYGNRRDELLQVDLGRLRFGDSRLAAAGARALIDGSANGRPQHFEWHRRDREGRWHWDEVFMKRVGIGGRDRVLALTREITDRKAAEAALRASEAQVRAMFNASIDALALLDAQGRVVDSNRALWRMLGDDVEPGERAAAAGRPTPAPAFLREVAARALAVTAQTPRDDGEAALHAEVSTHGKDGGALELELHAIPLLHHEAPHVLVIARDIGDKKRAAAELERQREALHQREKLAALGSLLAGVSHELNNPLSVVVARAVLLEEQGDAATRTAALKIRSAAERCARIVRSFLAMARQQRPARRGVDINEVVRAALDLAAYAMRSSGIEVVLDLAPALPPLLGDEDQLHQVMLNLLINAQQSVHEAPPPRRVEVASRHDAGAGRIVVTVVDNGPGIAAELRTRVFEPYFTTKPTGFGTGVGLAVSLGIVEAHGGTLTVESPPPGAAQGALFRVVLPVGNLAAQGAAEQAGDGDADTASAPRVVRVLVVDDEAEIRDALAQILRTVGHQVSVAASGREALRRLADAPHGELDDAPAFDAILTDMRMPELDGCALYREIERRWPALARRVIFITGDTLASSLREFVARSGRPVIEKPFMPQDVRRAVAELAGPR